MHVIRPYLFPIVLKLLCAFALLPNAHADDIFNASRPGIDTSIFRSQDEFLPVEHAFILEPRIENETLILKWSVAPNYYLYLDRFKLHSNPELTLTPKFSEGITKYDEFFEKDMTVFYQNTEITLPLAPFTSSFDLLIESQGCADAGLCYPPHTLAVHVDPKTQQTKIVPVTSVNVITPTAAIPVSTDSKSMWWLQALIFAIFGGVILNLMPCVFPVLSIKVLSLVRADREHLVAHGWVYTAGIVLCFLLFAGVLLLARKGGEAIGWGFQLQSPVLITLLAYLFFVMGLSLSGMLQLGASWMGAGQNLTQKSGLKGSFFTGVLAAIVASPCTAPFMGAALGFALTQPAIVGLSIFAALGFGMALPLLLLCYIPALAQRLPRPGPWMETLKEALAFPLYATAIWLLWVLGRQAGVDVLISACLGALYIALAIWLLNRRAKGIWQAIKLVLIIITLLAALFSPWQALTKSAAISRWQPYSADLLASLRNNKQAVLVNLTADWCITCLANERLTLSTDEVEAAFDEYQIATLKGDWTNRDPEITQLLSAYGRSGVPLYLWFPKGHQGPGEILPQLLTRTLVIDKLKQGTLEN